MKKTIRDVDVSGKRVLVRADFNVPLRDGEITDDARIRACLPTIEDLLQRGARVILCSHLGRPKGREQEELRLTPVARRLSELLARKVDFLEDCVGERVRQAVEGMGDGDVILLENTRFHPEEKQNDPAFAAKLAEPAELFVNDAFGTAHRAHASTEGVARHLPAVAGLLMEKELLRLSQVRDAAEPPFAAVMGGAKISDKIGVIGNLLDRLDLLLAGGGMANTLLRVGGVEIGRSLAEEDQLETAARIADRAGSRLVLPVDVVVAEDPRTGRGNRTVRVGNIPENSMILDVGPETLERFRKRLDGVRTVVWNGPLGAFEHPPFDRGTLAMAGILADLNAETIIGGGDTGAAVARAGVVDRVSHVSTGGGAFLSFIQGETLPGLAVLQDK
ncbi:MAG: phosphoglycerate kinase [Deltaproteobacteria bacterium]|nr:phosphoglycerate kinase [Deltaproteobacteria bacterium]